MSYKYYGGATVLKKALAAYKARTFKELYNSALKFPLNISGVTRRQYHELPRKEQNRKKDVAYLSPGCYEGKTATRGDKDIIHCNLLCFDIDDSGDARPYVEHPDLLSLRMDPFNFVAYHSATSTNKEPRIRIIVDADAIPKKDYQRAVASLASKLNVSLNKETRTAAIPMYRPCAFVGETLNPVFLAVLDGRPYRREDIDEVEADIELISKAVKGEELGDAFDNLEFLKARVPSFTIEDAKEALGFIDPSLPREEWVSVGMALCHQFGEDGWGLFDSWSSKSPKYDVEQSTRKVWESCSQSPRSRDPITARSILKRASEGGWNPDGVIAKEVEAAERELHALQGSRTEMVSSGLRVIAKIPMLSSSDEDTLLEALNATTNKAYKKKVSLPTLRKDLKKMRREERFGGKKQDKLFQWANDFCYMTGCDQFIKQMTLEKFSAEALDRTFSRMFLPPQGKKSEGELTELAPEILPQKYLLLNCDIPRVYAFLYDPTTSDKFITVENIEYLNTYVASYPDPDEPMADYCGEVLELHLENLIAEKSYRRTLLDWMAYQVQNPGRKIRWAPLLQGVQGCGKTFLAEALQAVLGVTNVKMVEASAVGQQWNEWAANCQLVALEEVRIVGHNRYEVLNKLKPLITNDRISISQRFQDQRTVPNITNYIFFTNFHDSIPIDDNDRRHFVIKSRLQTEEQVLEMEGSEEGGYFSHIFGMLEDFPGGLRAYLLDHKISKTFNPDGRAPKTSYHRELVENTSSEEKVSFEELLGCDPRVTKDFISARHLLLRFEVEGLDTTLRKVHNLLASQGYEKRLTIKCEGERYPIWTLTGSKWSGCDVREIKEEYAAREKGCSLLG